MKWIAREKLTGTIQTGTYNQLRELDKRVWYIEPVISSTRKNKFQLLMIKQGKASKATYPVVKSGYIPHGMGKLFINMVIDTLAYDKGGSTAGYNNYMTVKRIEHAI